MRPAFVTNLEPEALGEGRLKVNFGGHSAGQLPSVHDVEDYDWSSHHDQEVVYLIDVHFRYNRPGGPLKLQEQGGVDVYRHLLAHFSSRELPLMVAFYSPIAREDLVRLKPENYVLLLLPFIKGSYSGAFEAKLDEVVEHGVWPQFNNASENLLSGWALASKEQIRKRVPTEPIPRDGRKVLVVDDEMPQWEAALNVILGPENLSLLHYDKLKGTRGEFAVEKLGEDIEAAVRSADLILSDLYLEERHETTHWMSGEQLQDISGFKMFDLVKGTEDERGWNPGAPYLLHTSSNKVNYFRLFQAQGLDGWFVKDIRPDAPTSEKHMLYEVFAKGLSGTMSGDLGQLYSRLTAIWRSIDDIENRVKELWWYARSTEQDAVINILKSVWLGLRAFIGRGAGQYDRLGAFDEHVIVPAAYIGLLGQLREVIRVEENYQNFVFKALESIRHCGAHFRKRTEVRTEDVVLFMELWLVVLDATDINRSLLKRHRDRDANNEENPRFVNILHEGYYDDLKRQKVPPQYLNNQLLCTYLQLYNYEPGEPLNALRPTLQRRIRDLFRRANKGVLLKDIVEHDPISVKDRNFQERVLKRLSETIAENLSPHKLSEKGLSLQEVDGKIKVVHG